MKEFIITYFTDPVCVWCWGQEPVFRALETRYPGLFEVRHVMGGLVRSFEDLEDELNNISGSKEDVNGQVIAHWVESAQGHRMPIKTQGFHLFDQEHQSSYPMGIAYKAAQQASPRLADKYLRMLRVHIMARATRTNLWDAQVAIARETGLDVPLFEKALEDGSAKGAFQTDLGLTQGFGVRVFPTFQVKNQRGRQVMMRGFNTLKDFEKVFGDLSAEKLKPLAAPPETETLDWLLQSHGPLAQEEVFQAFDFESRQHADQWMEDRFASGQYVKEPVTHSFLLGEA